jgi:hypothetical protein
MPPIGVTRARTLMKGRPRKLTGMRKAEEQVTQQAAAQADA